ncbi:MAG: sulfate transporter CysZ [Gammaproteobacteria bacterium]|nr:sulfate transporter CysZ [Gammaproteobacteria bacterium]
MILNLFKGFGYIFKGLNIMKKPGIRRFVILPLTINIILFSVAIYLLIGLFDNWMNTLLNSFPDWLDWLSWLLWPIFAFIIFLTVFYTFTFVANIIAAPFNSILADKTEAMIKGQPLSDTPSFPVWQTVKKTLSSEIAKLIYILKWSIIILFISFIPVINLAAPFLWLIFGAWMLAMEYMDYPMSNHGHYFKEINKQVAADKSLSLGFGFGVFMFTSIPLLNFLAMPAAVTGATALWLRRESQIHG